MNPNPSTPSRLTAAGVAQAWEAEIAQRLDQLESGEAHTISAEEALRRIDARLRMRGLEPPS